MRASDQDARGMRAEKVMPHRAVRRPRPDIDGMRDQLLSVAAPRLQPQRASREIDRTFVTVAGDVTDVVDHARPVSFSGRLALGPCGKECNPMASARLSRSCSSANSVLASRL